jgi:hypothetical protein
MDAIPLTYSLRLFRKSKRRQKNMKTGFDKWYSRYQEEKSPPNDGRKEVTLTQLKEMVENMSDSQILEVEIGND